MTEPTTPASLRRAGRALAAGAAVLLGAGALVQPAGAAAPVKAATVKAAVKKGVLTVTGTSGPDVIVVRLRAGDATVLEIDVGGDGSADFAFARSTFAAINVNGGDGADSLTDSPLNGMFTDTEATTLDGEGGSDVIVGEHGPERLLGGAGDDTIDGNRGTDTIDGGDGSDTVTWDPGDQSDVVDGGNGTDTLAFNGANIGEQLAVVAVGSRVQLTRDVASVVMDLGGVEGIRIRALGGADTLTVADVSGTGLASVVADLDASTGGDDGSVDTISVPAGVTLGHDGSNAVVDGLGARVMGVNGSATDQVLVTGPGAADSVTVAGGVDAEAVVASGSGTDAVLSGATGSMSARLTGVEQTIVSLGAGDDSFTGIDGLAGITAFTVDGGPGQDTLLGGNGADLLQGGDGDDLIDGNQGVDTLVGGDGADTIQWDPGDGNDVVTGGAGPDQLLFNGANIGENLSVAAQSGHVRFTRDVAGIVLDIDDTEALRVRALGGADTISVADLAGTDLTDVTTDLSASIGGDDGSVDAIAVPAGVTVTRDGADAVVDGLGARVRAVNGSATDEVRVAGPTSADSVTLLGTSSADAVQAVASGTDVVATGVAGAMLVRLTGVEQTVVSLADGDDAFGGVGGLAALTTLTVDGGPGADTLLGGNGADLLQGGSGDDLIDGNQGVDTIVGGDGADTVQWDPGDGNDVIDGGAGTDVLAFNGANIGEHLTAAASAGHVRFTRDIAGIVLDVMATEGLRLRALGGSDVVEVGDLTGTGMQSVSVDLSAATGTSDATADQVTVDGTPGDDQLVVADDGAAVVVSGGPASVRVSGADPTLDRLTVAGLDGNDGITVSPGAFALMLLDILP